VHDQMLLSCNYLLQERLYHKTGIRIMHTVIPKRLYRLKRNAHTVKAKFAVRTGYLPFTLKY
jgi:hypothetical protein